MNMEKLVKWVRLSTIAVALASFAPGCDSGGGDDGGGDGGGSKGGSVVGQWAVISQEDGGQTWWQFTSDGNFAMYDNADFTAKHLGGTYVQKGDKVTGPFTNPGVGTGEIDATVINDGKTLQLDFIEHWHSPYKHVPLVGTKL